MDGTAENGISEHIREFSRYDTMREKLLGTIRTTCGNGESRNSSNRSLTICASWRGPKILQKEQGKLFCLYADETS